MAMGINKSWRKYAFKGLNILYCISTVYNVNNYSSSVVGVAHLPMVGTQTLFFVRLEIKEFICIRERFAWWRFQVYNATFLLKLIFFF